ncbi:MAG: hypothetical protein R3Y51_08085 [Rikenellaceae bacterium]
MSNYTLHEVKTKKEAKDFLNITNTIYKGTKNWIRPFDHEINEVFDPKKNELFNDGELIRWVLKDEKDNIIGRIAAFYSIEKAEEYEQPTGGCGFFECINSQEAANILFDAAKEWLISHKMEAMDGPINFGDRDKWWGVLVEGFEPPVYGMNYNHEYYKELFENYGFKNYYNQYTYGKDVINSEGGIEIGEAAKNKANRLAQNPDYMFKHLDKRNLKQASAAFVNIYNKAWAGFTGVKPMTQEQADNLFKTMKPVIDEKLIYFSYYKGNIVGFFIQIPELNQVIRHLNGKFNLWAKLKFLYYLKIKKECTTVLSLIFAVLPEHQGKGIESGMMNAFRSYAEHNKINYNYLELTWVGDFNPLMMRMMETYVESKITKIHVTYRYLFDREKPFTRAARVSRARVKKTEQAN